MEWLLLIEKIVISLFISLMTILLLFWCLPEGYFSREILHRKFGRYICWVGLDNYWALFAPRPISKNFLIGFEIELADGTLAAWKLPVYAIQGDYQVTPHFRYIKMHNQLLSQKDPVPKEAICRYIVNEFGKRENVKSAPLRVHIIQYYEPEPTGSFQLLPWHSQTIFTYEIQRDPENQSDELVIRTLA